MTKRILITCFIAFFAIIPVCSYGQNNNSSTNQKDKKSVIKNNNLDVIYQEEDYSGIVIDHKPLTSEDQSRIYKPPMLMPPPPPEEEDAVMTRLYQATGDEGVESEEDILLASADSTMIHSARLNLNSMRDTTYIKLVNPKYHQKFTFPTPDKARVTSHYGARRRRWHYGVDLAMPTGEPVYAAFDGVVRFSKYNSSYGNLIVIRHNNGLETYYAHLSRRNVHAGDEVKSGEVIGLCGNTGHSYGSHLHFEIRYKGIAMNPEHVVDCYKHTLIDDELKLTSRSFAKVGIASTGKVGAAPSSKSKSSNSYYKVRPGDNLGKIAKRNGTTIKKLCQLNGIKETTTLSIGRRLRVR